MTELFETGSRILAHGRRLFAPPPLAEMPAAYASLLRDPAELLEELWGGVEDTGPAAESGSPRLARRDGGGATPREPLSGGSQWLLDSPVNVAQTPASVSQAAPLRLSEGRPRAPLSKEAGRAPKAAPRGIEIRQTVVSDQVGAERDYLSGPNVPPLELAPEAGSASRGPRPVSGDRPAKIVEWPAARPAAAGGAGLATPGNVLQEREEELTGDPELLRLRQQLEVEEGKRRLRQEWPQEVSGGGTQVSRPYADPAPAPAPQTATSFSSVAQLLSKNVARTETDAAAAPREPEVLKGDDPPPVPRRAEEEARAGGSGRAETAHLVDEVLEELYERLRLEFSRTYGTTGG
ncbi:MAG TPA: hypothetical protein VN282_07695 [Pyrinomonadaceae bacterium]|nr:hypothetical protein [Pyrinomonadaceae bacterium]